MRDRRLNLVASVLVLVVGGLVSTAPAGSTVVLLDDSSLGYYNNSLGTVLDRTNPYASTYLFPGPDVTDGDPLINGAPEPDLSAAAGVLGDWLASPASLSGAWSGLQSIPATWATNTETAIVYQLDAGHRSAAVAP